MSKRTLIALLLLVPFVSSSCLYTRITRPLDENLDATILGDKVGRSSVHGVAWLVAWGDAGTQAAAQEGEITTIHHADQEVLSILGGLIYSRVTTILYGE
ncbi:MAG: hypothetical protein ACI841_000979 [Planctomycetota bacterium]|jgi:hypothetical protein